MLRWLNFSSCYSIQFLGFCIVITILYMLIDIRIDNISNPNILDVLINIILIFIFFIILGLGALASRGLL